MTYFAELFPLQIPLLTEDYPTFLFTSRDTSCRMSSNHKIINNRIFYGFICMFLIYFMLLREQVACAPVSLPNPCSKCDSNFNLCKTSARSSRDHIICLASKDKCFIKRGCLHWRTALSLRLERKVQQFMNGLLRFINQKN